MEEQNKKVVFDFPQEAFRDLMPYDQTDLKITAQQDGQFSIKTTVKQLYQTKALQDYLNILQIELSNNEKNLCNAQLKIFYWVYVKLIRYPTIKQPSCLDEIDECLIKQFRSYNFSYADIGFILDRSASSVFEYCKKISLAKKEQEP